MSVYGMKIGSSDFDFGMSEEALDQWQRDCWASEGAVFEAAVGAGPISLRKQERQARWTPPADAGFDDDADVFAYAVKD